MADSTNTERDLRSTAPGDPAAVEDGAALDRALLARARATATLCSSLSHDLNGVLHGLLTNARLAHEECVRDAPDLRELREILEDVLAGAGHLERLAQDLRGLARYDDGAGRAAPLAPAVDGALRVLHSALARRVQTRVEGTIEGSVAASPSLLVYTLTDALIGLLASEPRGAEVTPRPTLTLASSVDRARGEVVLTLALTGGGDASGFAAMPAFARATLERAGARWEPVGAGAGALRFRASADSGSTAPGAKRAGA